MTKVQTASALEDAETYIVNILLPNRVGFPMMQVTKANLGASNDILIGMDIISQGDFSITNQGNTVFSFRVPSAHTVDFVKPPAATQNPPVLATSKSSTLMGCRRP